MRLGLLVPILLTLPLPALAQVRASERGSVSQTIDGTVLTIDYARPRARGRDSLFGKVVQWNEVWTPGANFATTLELNKNARLDGHPVPQGKYSVWLVVRRSGDWTFVLDPEWHRYHEYPPDSSATQIRFVVHPRPAPLAEQITWWVPQARVSDADLVMHWGTTEVALKLAVEPTYQLTLSAADAAPYLGRWAYQWTRPERHDSATLVLSYQRGMLKASFEPRDEYWDDMTMVRIADDWFIAGLFQQGQLYEMVKEWVFEFHRTGAKATTMEFRDQGDKVVGTARRLP